MDDTKNFWQRLFKRNRNDSPQSEAEKEHSLREQLESLACNLAIQIRRPSRPAAEMEMASLHR